MRRRSINRLENLEERRLLAGDLIARWLADDIGDVGELDAWIDSVAGISASSLGSPQRVPNQYGGRAVVRFDPTDGDDGFKIALNDNPLPQEDFSVAVAFAATANIPGESGEWFTNAGLVDGNALGFGHDWGISMAPDGRISAGMGSGFGNPPVTLYSEASGLNDHALHTMLFTRHQNTISIYVDGILDSQRDDVSTVGRIQRDLRFGILKHEKLPFSGDIGEIRFFNDAVSSEEAAAVHEEIYAYFSNLAPVAVRDEYSFKEDSILNFVERADGVLANDIDVDGDALTAELVETTKHGRLTFESDGSFLYIPEKNFFGQDSFSYVANDFRNSNVATAVIHVENVYDPVFGISDTYKILPSETISLKASDGVLSNDLNLDKAVLSAILESDVSAGDLILRGDGSFDYSPNGFAGSTTFQYRIDDGVNLSAPISVSILVNTPPIANQDVYQLAEDSQLVLQANDGILQNDQDVEGDALTAILVSPPEFGSLSFQSIGAFSYTPNANYFGEDQFHYRLNDGIDLSEIVSVHLDVLPVNDAPTANGDSYFAPANSRLEISADSGVLKNDTDLETELLTAQISSGPKNGTLELGADGSFVYSPSAEFRGIDTFSYRAFDGELASAEVAVSIFVDTSPVVVSEFLSANVEGIETKVRESVDDNFPRRDTLNPDWIELQNLSDSEFDISGFHLSDDLEDSRKWRFPDGTTIAPNDYLVVYATGRDVSDPNLDETGRLHTNFALNVRGEDLTLAFPDGRIAQHFEPKLQYPDVSYGGNKEPAHFQSPTLGMGNSEFVRGVVSPIQFGTERGIYQEAFALKLSTNTPETTIRYTLDGTEPTLENGFEYIQVVPIEATATVRATAFRDGFLPAEVQTHSYLFLADVIQHPLHRDGYPTTWAGEPADYGMDPDIVGENNLFDDLYRNTIFDDLKSLPTLSLTFDPDHMFSRQGIYQTPTRTGDAAERPTSVEFFDPLGKEEGFHVNSGIRIMGGSSRQPDIPKHSFRLEFREQYGWGKLNYPMFEQAPFGESAVTSFDELVVRVGFNNSWMHRHYYQAVRGEQPRDQWVRDLQFAMGHPSSHGRYIHVYLNGMYWGIYNLQERPAAPYMESYFGGNKETDWDVINSNDAIDGSTRAWLDLHRDARNVRTPEEYEAFKDRVDVVNLADYMILNYYVGNTDWDGHNWISAAQQGEPFRLFAWDSEFAISLPPSNQALGQSAENQIINFNKTGQNSNNNPSGLHQRLLRNDEYRTLVGDRIRKHMFNDGILTPEIARQWFEVRSDEIDRAVVAESARWGDYRRDVDSGRWRSNQFDLYTRDEHYVAQKKFIIERYLPVRTGIVIEQLRRSNMYPDLDAPSYNQHGGRVAMGFDLTISGPQDSVIYYSLNGTDPRQSGGGLHPDALSFDTPIKLTQNVVVRSRAFKDGEWSALTEAEFKAAELASANNLRITEIHYHPAEPSVAEQDAGIISGEEFEFIELMNISAVAIDLSAVQFVRTQIDGNSEGIDFDFANSDVQQLLPGQRIVVVENLDAFGVRYSAVNNVAGQWSGRLSNSDEQITLLANGETVHQIRYDDGWHATTDGQGFSLEKIEPRTAALESWSQADGWHASFVIGGTPAEASVIPGDSNHDGRFNSRDLVLVFQIGEFEDETANNSTFEDGDWNGDGDFTTSDLVYVFQLDTFQQDAVAMARSTNLVFKDVENRRNRRLAVDEVMEEEFGDFGDIES